MTDITPERVRHWLKVDAEGVSCIAGRPDLWDLARAYLDMAAMVDEMKGLYRHMAND